MTIRILPDHLINQIAAGEVVERPASVVKELVENSLDSGADNIVVDVVDGGRTLICVTDNGSGMTRDDLISCVERHATSKLKSDDLLNINTMGFRGEALPSIASVSDVVIDTAHGGESWSIDVSDNKKLRPSSWTVGTRIMVNNLFQKTPARLKFLRSDRAETSAVIDIVKRLALSRMDVGFYVNKKHFYQKSNDNPIERIYSVIGDDVRGRLLPIDVVDGDIKLSGWVSEPTMRRPTASDQYLFVNNRPVRDKLLLAALRAAYFDVMSAREYPICVLYLDVPTNMVDVNVHPAKTEVHFLEPSRIRSIIVGGLRRAISASMKDRDENFTQISQPNNQQKIQFYFDRERPKIPVNMTHVAEPLLFSKNSENQVPGYMLSETEHRPLGRALAQIMNKYILAESDSGLIIVDQHAAHERIVYEQLRNRDIKRQPLLVPHVIELDDADAILEMSSELEQCGLIIESFGDNTIVVREVPAGIKINWDESFKNMSRELHDNNATTALSEKLHHILATYACHHSVRAGQRLDLDQMNALLRQIEETERAGQCNHGRPVFKAITQSELDSMFERI